MKILVIGSGGREHAIAESYAKNKKVTHVFVVPGNDFMIMTNKKIVAVTNIKIMDFDKVLQFAKKEKVDIVDVAQDDVLAAGFVDKFTAHGLLTFGPTQQASQLEWSKEWSRKFMTKYNLPIPIFQSFNDVKKALAYLTTIPNQLLYIKASGLALGKGVIRADGREQAKEAIRQMGSFGKSGEIFLIEEGLTGEEFTLFAICDGTDYIITKPSQDHKTIYNGESGPNTGGVGSVAPARVITSRMLKDIEKKIIKPTLYGMIKEGKPYTGILYIGGIVTKKGIKIIEFNARWGDPEAEVILPGIQTDYLQIVQSVLNKRLKKLSIKFDNKIRVSVAGCAKGYPTDYSTTKGKEIFGLLEASKLPGISVFGSGIIKKRNRLFVNGGRIFHLVATGETITQARVRAYGAMAMIQVEGNNLHYRTDIGWRDVERKKI